MNTMQTPSDIQMMRMDTEEVVTFDKQDVFDQAEVIEKNRILINEIEGKAKVIHKIAENINSEIFDNNEKFDKLNKG